MKIALLTRGRAFLLSTTVPLLEVSFNLPVDYNSDQSLKTKVDERHRK